MLVRRILAALALLCALIAPAQAQQTKAALNSEITTNFPDQTVGQITPAGLRQVVSDIVNSIMPTAPVVGGNLACFDGTTGLLRDCGAGPTTNPLVVATTPISGGTTTRVLFDNAGVLGEYTISGTGSVCMTTSCIMITPALGTPASGVATNLTGTAAGLTAGTVTTNANLTGDVTSTGNATTVGKIGGVAVSLGGAFTTTGGLQINPGSTGTIPVWTAGILSGAAFETITNSAAPSAPAAGNVSIWTDSTDLRLHDKNASGVIGTTVVADTGAANNFLTAISAAGAISKAQPSASNLSNGVTGSGAVVLATAPTVTSLTNSSGVFVIGSTAAYAWGGAFNFMQIGSGAGLLASTSGAGAAEFESNVFFDGANYKYMTTNPASKVAFGNGSFAVATAPSGTAGNTATMTNFLNLTNAGLFGIGSGITPGRTLDVLGVVGWRNSGTTLVNGLNSNITLPTTSRVRISGPSAAFSVGGFTGGTDGAILLLYNTTAQAMTIVNEDASSTAANRIKTLTGANVVLRTGTSFATVSYDVTDSRWILESSN